VLYDALVEWNLDEKISTLTLDNCSTNDKVIPELVKKIGKSKLMLDGTVAYALCCPYSKLDCEGWFRGDKGFNCKNS